MRLFIEKTKAEFPIIHHGKTIGEKYGIVSYPTVVLIGNDGKVLDSGGFDKKLVEELINKNL